MNHFSYEVIGKEKVKNIQEEGLRSQELHRSAVARTGLLRSLPRLFLTLLGLLGLISLMVR